MTMSLAAPVSRGVKFRSDVLGEDRAKLSGGGRVAKLSQPSPSTAQNRHTHTNKTHTHTLTHTHTHQAHGLSNISFFPFSSYRIRALFHLSRHPDIGYAAVPTAETITHASSVFCYTF